MKRGAMLLHWSASASSVILTLSLFVTGGCSSSEGGGGDDAANAVGRYGLKRSEFIALKKANKNPNDLKQAAYETENGKVERRGFRRGDNDVRKTNEEGSLRRASPQRTLVARGAPRDSARRNQSGLILSWSSSAMFHFDCRPSPKRGVP